MFKQQTMEALIQEKIPLGNPDARGFYSFKCPLCNDYKPRGGLKFENNSVIFNCFNCSTASVFEEGSEKVSRKMRQVLTGLGIDDSEISSVTSSSFFNRKEETTKITLDTLTKVSTLTPPTKLPSNSYLLGQTLEYLDEQERLVKYLLKREVDLDRYKFFFSSEPRFKDRVIIPFYRNGQIIYWQARSIHHTENKRYDNAAVSRDAVIFNFDELYRHTSAPLFVCEGVFDAMMFDGIAILGSKLTQAKLELLNNSRRRIVFVIDKDGNGRKLAHMVLSVGWEITFAPEGADDINKAVQRFGRTWTAEQLMRNIPTDEASAAISIGLNCGGEYVG